jgi:hypothetical protein
MAMVSCVVVESSNGLAKSAESLRTTGPVELRPRDITFVAVLPITVTRIDFPTTAELPEKGLRIFTSGGGRLPVAITSVSTPEVFPAPSMAVAVIVRRTGWNGARREQRERELNVRNGAREHRIVHEANGANCLNVDGLQTEVVLGLGRKCDDGVGTPAQSCKIQRRRDAIALRIDRRVVVACSDRK